MDKKERLFYIIVIIVLLFFIIFLLFNNSNKWDCKCQDNLNLPENVTNNTLPKNEEEIQNLNEIGLLSELKTFFKNTDKNVKKLTPILKESDYQTEFTNLDKSVYNDNILLKCEEFKKIENFGCEKYTITINNKITFTEDLIGECTNGNDIYRYSDYIVNILSDECSGKGIISIYKDSENPIFTTDLVYTKVYDDKEFNNEYNVYPSFKNNKLYFMETSNIEGEMYLKYIDFKENNLTENKLKTYTAYHAENS